MPVIGIVVAMQPEAVCLTTLRPQPGTCVEIGPGLLLHLCGVGSELATRGAKQLIADGATGLVSFGTAGGLIPGLAPGALLIPERVEAHGESHYPHNGWRTHVHQRLTAAGMRIFPGNMTDADKVVSTSAQKAALGVERNAVAVDMESAAVLRLAAQSGIPALVMRVIVDPVTMELPGFLLKRTDIYGRADMPGILMDLARAPSRLPALLQLSRAFRAATQTMQSLGKQLHDFDPGHDVLSRAR